MKNSELKEIDIKNCTCYYFEDIWWHLMTFKIEDLDFDNIVIDEKSYENILVYNISYKTLIDWKPLPIMFNKVDRFIRVCDGIRCLVLFYNKKIVLLMIKLDISLVKKMALPILFDIDLQE